MKAILIDANECKIEEIEIEKDIYEYICTLVDDSAESLQIDKNNVLYVDSHGLLKKQTNYIKLDGYLQPLPPIGIIIGVTEEDEEDEEDEEVAEGDAIYQNCSYPIEKAKQNIMFITRKEAHAIAKMNDTQNRELKKLPFLYCPDTADLFK